VIRRTLITAGSILLGLGAFAAAAHAAEDDSAKLSKDAADKLLVSGHFKPVKSKNELPNIWWQAIGLNNMSDIGGPFSAGCTGTAPHRRLLLAAVDEPYAIILSESGGIAYMTRFQIYKHEKENVREIYSEYVQEPRIEEIEKKLGIR
jgi:hypothetical protein